MRFSRGKAGLAGRRGDEGKEGRERAGKAEEGKVGGEGKMGKVQAQEQVWTSGRFPVPRRGEGFSDRSGQAPPPSPRLQREREYGCGAGIFVWRQGGAGRWFAEAGSAGGIFPGCRDCAGVSFRPHLRWPISASASRHHRNKGRSFRILMKKVRPPVPRMGRSVGRTGFHGWLFFLRGGRREADVRGACAFRMQPPFICGVKRRFVVQVPRQYGVSGADVPPRPSLRLKMSRAGPA